MMQKKVTRFRKVVLLLMVVAMLLNCNTIALADPDASVIQANSESKISSELQEKMDAVEDGEYLPVWITLKTIEPTVLNEMILEKTGFDPDIYEDTALFNKVVLPEIEEEVRMKQRMESDASSAGKDSKQSEETLIKTAKRERIEEYIQQKRAVRWEEYAKRNQKFLEDTLVKRNDREIISCSPFAPLVIVELTKPEIKRLAKNSMVESLNYYVNQECKPAMSDATSQVGVYCEGGTGYTQPGMWSALTGEGIKIGVLEVSDNGYGGKFDATAPLLSGKTNLYFIENPGSEESGAVPYIIDSHATEVVSIIAGKSVVYNGKTYRGVVPDATVYQMPITNSDDAIVGIYLCLAYGVSIINMSFGLEETDSFYSVTDWLVDYIVREENVVVVAAAGNAENNSWDVTSPGRALNAITVGNAETKTNTNSVLVAPYALRSTSCYDEESYFPNKPDLVAPGCFSVLMKNANNQATPVFIRGTSFSAPIVTGIAAQIIENNPEYMLKPMLVKAALLVGADLSKINTTNDTPTTAFFYDKCGAGMVNAIESVNDVNVEYYGPISGSTNCDTFYLNAGDRIRAVLSFSKNYESNVESTSDLDDLDLILVYKGNGSSNSAYSYSLSYTNNNEIIDVTILQDGLYRFNIYRRGLNDPANPTTACVVYKLYT